jgi:hypothetical protein
MGVRADHMVMNTNCFKIRIEFLIFTTPICLNRFYFKKKLALNERLKLMKNIKNIRLSNHRIKPDKLCMGIHKKNKIAKTI